MLLISLLSILHLSLAKYFWSKNLETPQSWKWQLRAHRFRLILPIWFCIHFPKKAEKVFSCFKDLQQEPCCNTNFCHNLHGQWLSCSRIPFHAQLSQCTMQILNYHPSGQIRKKVLIQSKVVRRKYPFCCMLIMAESLNGEIWTSKHPLNIEKVFSASISSELWQSAAIFSPNLNHKYQVSSCQNSVVITVLSLFWEKRLQSFTSKTSNFGQFYVFPVQKKGWYHGN